MIYDGRCGFCRIWIEYWKGLTGDAIDYAASQEVGDRFPQIPPGAFAESVQLVRTDGTVASGARAVFEALGRQRLYESSRALRWALEAGYRFIARRRSFFYQVTRFTFGTRIEPPSFHLTQWIFLRALAAIFMIAFASLGEQALGLIGERGISPAHDYLARIASSFGPMRYVALPTVFWWDSGDRALQSAAAIGVAMAALALFGRLERLALLGCYVLYLSFSLAGQEFLTFQWDSLLLEAGFLAIFFGRSGWGARTIAWLYRLLVFRLYFLSGYVKLGSHDPTWRNLTALDYHFHTQPLPTVIAWYADKLPRGLLKASTFATLAIELATPFLIFAPRRLRLAGAWLMIALQVLIFLTGNYTFFNLLTIALILFLFDDRDFAWLNRFGKPQRRTAPSQPAGSGWTCAFNRFATDSGGDANRGVDRGRRAGAPRDAGPVRRSLANRQYVWAVRGHDHYTPGDYCSGLRGRRNLVQLRVQVQTRRPSPRPPLGAAIPASPGLADVVRGPGQLSIESLVRRFCPAFAARLSRRSGAACDQPLSRPSAEVRARGTL